MPPDLPSRRLCRLTRPFDVELERLDMEALRRGFGDLFDRAAAEVQRRGLDLDDVVLDRLVHIRGSAGFGVWVAVSCLSDRERFLAELRQTPSREQGPDPSLRRLRSVAIFEIAVDVLS